MDSSISRRTVLSSSVSTTPTKSFSKKFVTVHSFPSIDSADFVLHKHQFNAHVFKLEQEEYVREKINWTFIDYSDNQPTIDLIEGKLGILSLLDEESRLPSGSDTNFVQKLYTTVGKPENSTVFKKPRFGTSAFTIAHYALDVTYEVEGFLEKNRDTVPDELLALLNGTTNMFLKEVLDRATVQAEKAAGGGTTGGNDSRSGTPTPGSAGGNRSSVMGVPGRKGPGGGGGSARKPTLGSIFKASLISLMDTIDSTNAHYIRCIKPNEAKLAWEFEPQMVLGQLRACGVLETIRISCAGYPTRWTFEEFAERLVFLVYQRVSAKLSLTLNRYYMLVKSDQWGPDIRTLCTRILEETIKEADKFQVGLTKIFFRAGLLARFEQFRAGRLNDLTLLIQKNFRRHMAVKNYSNMRKAAIGVQTVWRAVLAKRKVEVLRKEKAAIMIQSVARGFLQRAKYNAAKQAVVGIQSSTCFLLCGLPKLSRMLVNCSLFQLPGDFECEVRSRRFGWRRPLSCFKVYSEDGSSSFAFRARFVPFGADWANPCLLSGSHDNLTHAIARALFSSNPVFVDIAPRTSSKLSRTKPAPWSTSKKSRIDSRTKLSSSLKLSKSGRRRTESYSPSSEDSNSNCRLGCRSMMRPTHE